MKVFLSWSGDASHKVACVLRDWIPSVIQAVHPYVSSEDIDKGTRWSTDIAQELAESTYGILCITRENLSAPWINFEAGALSKTIDKANVSPFLFGIKRSEVHGPLLQFQSTIYEKEDVGKLLLSLNNRIEERDRLEDSLLRKSFNVWWPQLQEQLDAVDEKNEGEQGDKPEKKEGITREALTNYAVILEELLELARNQQKLLRSPEDLLPPSYVEFILRNSRRAEDPLREELTGRVHRDVIEIERHLEAIRGEVSHPGFSELFSILDRVHRAIHDLGWDKDRRHRRIPKDTSPPGGIR
jgi:hypothetical protein